jgi:hypothetical protein
MRMRSLGLALAVSGWMAAAAGAQVTLQGPDSGLAPTGKGGGVYRPNLEKRRRKPPPPPPANNGIDYHNGPVMLGTVHIYYIWYGDWSDQDTISILTDLAENIGGTPWFNINSSYYDRSNKHVGNAVTYNGSTTDDYSHGAALSDDDIEGIVADAIASKRLPKDANGVYFVLTSPDVDETSGFCSNFCGWHFSDKISGADIKFSFIGGADRCLNHCSRQRFHSPNNNPAADAMASILAHELSESVTDPDLNAWYSNNTSEENADKCAWTFGEVYPIGNGSNANVQWGSRDYLIQQNWVNAKGGSCALSYP